ncbi:MAG: sugar phosphate isomerase/epimerase [Clostridia bacterium]|nr:sugar phosphate isomerase/epimerase [Clostridia bacterium]
MKIGITFNPYDNAYARFGKQKFSKIAQHGFSAVDYNMADTGSDIYTASEPDLEKMISSERESAERAGIVISQVHGPWRWPPQDSSPELRKERLEKMKKSIRITRMLGCKYWVVHPIMPFGISDADTENAQKTFDLNKEFMSQLLIFAKENGITICLENMPMRDFSLATPEKILKFVQEMNDPNFKICLDTGHVAIFNDLLLGDVVGELGDNIKVVHVHDNMGDGDYHLFPTKGKSDWQGFAKGLKDIKFDGVFSLETLPSQNLSDDEFENECIKLFEISKSIVE